MYGQAAMHMPQTPERPSRAMLTFCMPAMQAFGSQNSSRGIPARQFCPEQALPGQISTHTVQSPQRDSAMGVGHDGASVSTVPTDGRAVVG